jgi:hypothetical protein
MNRFGAILVMLLCSSSAFAQAGPRDLAGQNETLEQPQGQLRRSVTTLYIFSLKDEVGLTDEQFMKALPTIQNFIRMRFENANTKKTLDERQNQLLRQPDASEADIQKLNEEVTKLEGETGTWEGRMVRKLQAELGDRQLSDRQILALRSYNRKFFNERLPTLLEQMRAGNTPPRGQRPGSARGNPPPNNQATRPANTLRGNDAQPVQPRQKLAR